MPLKMMHSCSASAHGAGIIVQHFPPPHSKILHHDQKCGDNRKRRLQAERSRSGKKSFTVSLQDFGSRQSFRSKRRRLKPHSLGLKNLVSLRYLPPWRSEGQNRVSESNISFYQTLDWLSGRFTGVQCLSFTSCYLTALCCMIGFWTLALLRAVPPAPQLSASAPDDCRTTGNVCEAACFHM